MDSYCRSAGEQAEPGDSGAAGIERLPSLQRGSYPSTAVSMVPRRGLPGWLPGKERKAAKRCSDEQRGWSPIESGPGWWGLTWMNSALAWARFAAGRAWTHGTG